MVTAKPSFWRLPRDRLSERPGHGWGIGWRSAPGRAACHPPGCPQKTACRTCRAPGYGPRIPSTRLIPFVTNLLARIDPRQRHMRSRGKEREAGEMDLLGHNRILERYTNTRIAPSVLRSGGLVERLSTLALNPGPPYAECMARKRHPKRIQRKRTKDWKMPKNAVYVGRPGKWGNPFFRLKENPTMTLTGAFWLRCTRCG